MKYSIIIPARNGGEYLQACIETIIFQDYDDYELIISDDHSTDGTKEYLATLFDNSKIKVIEPTKKELSMTEHWEWALSHAIGSWQIFVGQDDGLQPYFFKLADKLTNIADKKKIRTIMSQRAYYFWEGCEPVYGDVSVSFIASNKTKIHNSAFEASKALFGIQNYFELPEMYTTSLFHKSILDEARLKQNGKVLTCHPQDANLGVIACSLDKHYLKSYIPLGWVGSSPKSAGMAIGSENKNFNKENAEVLKDLQQEYRDKIKKSKFEYNELAGDFAFGNIQLYFWQAFLETPSLRSEKINKVLISNFFKYIFFSAINTSLFLSKQKQEKKYPFKKILNKNKCLYSIVISLSSIILIFTTVSKIIYIFFRIIRKLHRLFFSQNSRINFNRSSNKNMTMRKASEIVLEKTKDLF